MPRIVGDLRLVLEPNHPYKELEEILDEKYQKEESRSLFMQLVKCCRGNKIERLMESDEVGVWWSSATHSTIAVMKDRDTGKLWCIKVPEHHNGRFKLMFNTIAASRAWDLNAELEAQKKLKELVSDWAYERYMLTGSFVETSERSKLIYLFRKLRPTLVLSAYNPDNITYLAALCMHPVGYYENSFGGALVPTDDVIAHLLLMRSDEHYLWKKSTQHPVCRNNAGI